MALLVAMPLILADTSIGAAGAVGFAAGGCYSARGERGGSCVALLSQSVLIVAWTGIGPRCALLPSLALYPSLVVVIVTSSAYLD